MKAFPRIVQEEPGGPVLLKLWIEGKDVAVTLTDGEQRELCRALVEIVLRRDASICGWK